MSSSATATLPENTTAPAEAKPRLRLEFLDGLRGLAALYVVLCHVCALMTIHINIFPRRMWFDNGGLPPFMGRLWPWLQSGHYAVDIFIVLSGFCLMLPVAKSTGHQLSGGNMAYLGRRARRILPPYYAALALALLLILLVPGLQHGKGTFWNTQFPVFTPGALLSHLFLIQNLRPNWIYAIDGPMWSVATEWQIYFLLPFLLLPVWRCFKITGLVIAGIALGMMPHYLFHGRFDGACPWYIGLFALGMAGASICFNTQEDIKVKQWPWGVIFLACLGATFLISEIRSMASRSWIEDIFAGTTTACLLVFCTRRQISGASSPILKTLNSRFSVTLGLFSYSLYLVHFPVLMVLDMILRNGHASAMMRFATLLLVGIPLSTSIAYVFHLAFERPFMPGHPRTRRQTIVATIREPAI